MARWKHIIWFACMCTSQQSNFSQSYNIPWSIPLPLHISVLKAHNNLQHQHNLPRHADFIISNDFVLTLLIFFPCTFHILFKVWQNIKYSFSCCHISKKQWAIPDFSLINKEDARDHSTWKKLIKNVWQRAIKRLCVCVPWSIKFPDLFQSSLTCRNPVFRQTKLKRQWGAEQRIHSPHSWVRCHESRLDQQSSSLALRSWCRDHTSCPDDQLAPHSLPRSAANTHGNSIQTMHGSECDIQMPECDIFNIGSSYLNVARTTVFHLFCCMTNH